MRHMFVDPQMGVQTCRAHDLPAEYQFGVIYDDGSRDSSTARWYTSEKERDDHILGWQKAPPFQSDDPADNVPVVWLCVTRAGVGP